MNGTKWFLIFGGVGALIMAAYAYRQLASVAAEFFVRAVSISGS